MRQFAEHEKLTMVRLLARWCGPTEVAAIVSKEFGREVIREEVWRYSPTNPRCSKKWREVFDEERRRFLESLDEQPLYHQAFRLEELAKIYQQAGRNLKLKADVLRQAAEEVGGRYTNERQLTGKDGNPLSVAISNAMDLAAEITDVDAARKRLEAARKGVSTSWDQ